MTPTTLGTLGTLATVGSAQVVLRFDAHVFARQSVVACAERHGFSVNEQGEVVIPDGAEAWETLRRFSGALLATALQQP